MKTKLRNQKGFTIIEVLIVLAIAGLILLIVFLAVPALQRNSRNTQRKNDAAAILGAVTEWSTNNAGKMPLTALEQGEALANAKTGIYNGAITWSTAPPGSVNALTIAVNNKCNGTAIAAQNRAVAVQYEVETGSGSIAKQCTES